MDQETPKLPARRNTFVIVAAILFNLLWIALLFLSCQADNAPNPTPTPEAGIENHPAWILFSTGSSAAAFPKDVQNWGRFVPVYGVGQQAQKFTAVFCNYNEPRYKPPSTGSITPVI